MSLEKPSPPLFKNIKLHQGKEVTEDFYSTNVAVCLVVVVFIKSTSQYFEDSQSLFEGCCFFVLVVCVR